MEFLEFQDLQLLAKNWWPPSPLGQTGPGHDKACQKLILQVGQHHERSRNVSPRFNAAIKRITNFPAEKPFGYSRHFNSHQKMACHFQGSPTRGPLWRPEGVIIYWERQG